jgi:hypothetical protein
MPSSSKFASGGGLTASVGGGSEAAHSAGEGSAESGVCEKARQCWSGVVEDTWWFYFTGDSTDEIWQAYIDHCKKMLKSGEERPALVCIAHRADSPTGDQRRLIGDFINSETKRLRSLVGFVLVLDSPLHILALKAINWFAKKPFAETVCGSPDAAASWLHTRGAKIDAQVLKQALDSEIPLEHRWAP